jgi:serine protease Do
VVTVSPGGAAAKAGVEPGDLIEAVDGEPTQTMSDMLAALYLLPPDQSVTLDVDTNGHLWDAHARLMAAA